MLIYPLGKSNGRKDKNIHRHLAGCRRESFLFSGFEARRSSGRIIGLPFMLLGQSIYNIHP
jgi:hypothetical protein